MSCVVESRPVATDRWQTICKSADESRASTTTLTADSELKIAMAANTTYVFELTVFYNTPITPDFKYGHDGPASPTSVRVWRLHTTPGGTSFSGIAIDAAYNTTGVSITTSSTAPGAIHLKGLIVNGSTAGDFAFTWAQNTSNASNTTVEKGSRLRYSVVG